VNGYTQKKKDLKQNKKKKKKKKEIYYKDYIYTCSQHDYKLLISNSTYINVLFYDLLIWFAINLMYKP